MSYGAHADDLLTTFAGRRERRPAIRRRSTSADQHVLDPQGTWDLFGMRGPVHRVTPASATFAADQVVKQPFAQIAPQSMVPVRTPWSHLWLGIVMDAFDRAGAFVRAQAKRML